MIHGVSIVCAKTAVSRGVMCLCLCAARTEIVTAFDQLHRSRQYRVQINRSVSAFHIASRVMRKDNYLIALMNKNMLDFQVRVCWRARQCMLGCSMALCWSDSVALSHFVLSRRVTRLRWSCCSHFHMFFFKLPSCLCRVVLAACLSPKRWSGTCTGPCLTTCLTPTSSCAAIF